MKLRQVSLQCYLAEPGEHVYVPHAYTLEHIAYGNVHKNGNDGSVWMESVVHKLL